MTEYLTTADALFFHRLVTERYGGASGLRDAGALEAALHRPQTGYYDTLVHEAAALFEGLLQSHPFVDNNRRLAFAITDVFLRINGCRITADSQAIAKTLEMYFDDDAFDLEHMAAWLKQNVERMPLA